MRNLKTKRPKKRGKPADPNERNGNVKRKQNGTPFDKISSPVAQLDRAPDFESGGFESSSLSRAIAMYQTDHTGDNE